MILMLRCRTLECTIRPPKLHHDQSSSLLVPTRRNCNETRPVYYCLVQSLKMLFTYDERFLLLVPKGLICPHHPEIGTSRASLSKFLLGPPTDVSGKNHLNTSLQDANGKPSRMTASTSASGSKV